MTVDNHRANDKLVSQSDPRMPLLTYIIPYHTLEWRYGFWISVYFFPPAIIWTRAVIYWRGTPQTWCSASQESLEPIIILSNLPTVTCLNTAIPKAIFCVPHHSVSQQTDTYHGLFAKSTVDSKYRTKTLFIHQSLAVTVYWHQCQRF